MDETDESDALSLSFLDVLCCALGGAILLFLVYSVLPHRGQIGDTGAAEAGPAMIAALKEQEEQQDSESSDGKDQSLPLVFVHLVVSGEVKKSDITFFPEPLYAIELSYSPPLPNPITTDVKPSNQLLLLLPPRQCFTEVDAAFVENTDKQISLKWTEAPKYNFVKVTVTNGGGDIIKKSEDITGKQEFQVLSDTKK